MKSKPIICPKCEGQLKNLLGDEIASWICQKCGDGFTDGFLKDLTEEKRQEMIIKHAKFKVFQASYYDRLKNPPLKDVLKPDPKKGLGKLFNE